MNTSPFGRTLCLAFECTSEPLSSALCFLLFFPICAIVIIQSEGGFTVTFMQALLDKPWVFVLISNISGIFCCFVLSTMAGALLKMHRSKTKVKKLLTCYSFWQRLLLQPAKEHCLHAKRFCGQIIFLYKLRIFSLIALPAMFIIAGLPELKKVICYLSGGFFLLLDLPAFVLDSVLSKPHLFRPWNGYRFEKYHNTEDHNSLM